MEQLDVNEYDFLYKLVLVGDTKVGKSALLHRYMNAEMPSSISPTVDVKFASKIDKLANGSAVKVHIWDTAGAERNIATTSAHFRKAVGALIVYDVTQMTTFQNIDRWVRELRSNADPDVVIILVGNKTDLVESNPESRQVNTDVAREMAESNSILFMETSAMNGQQVEDTFFMLLNDINERGVGRKKAEAYSLKAVERKEKGVCCC